MRFFRSRRFWIILSSAGLLSAGLATGLAYGLPRNSKDGSSNLVYSYTKNTEDGIVVDEYRTIPYQTDMTVEANKNKYDFVASEKEGYLPVEKQFDNLDTSLDVDTQGLKKVYYYGVDSHTTSVKPMTYNIYYKLSAIPAAREASGQTKNITVYYEKEYSGDFSKVVEEITPKKYDTYDNWSQPTITNIDSNKTMTMEEATTGTMQKFKVAFGAAPDKNHTGTKISYEVFFNVKQEAKTEDNNTNLVAKEVYESVYGTVPELKNFELPTIKGYTWRNQMVFANETGTQVIYNNWHYNTIANLEVGQKYQVKFMATIDSNFVSSNKYIWYTVNCVVTPAITVQKTATTWDKGVSPFGATSIYQIPNLFPNKEKNYDNWTIKSVSSSKDGFSLDPTLAVGEVITIEFEAKPDKNHSGENATQIAKFTVTSKPNVQIISKVITNDFIVHEFKSGTATGVEEVTWKLEDLVAGNLQWTSKPVEYLSTNGRRILSESNLAYLRPGMQFYAVYSAAPDNDLYTGAKIIYKAVLYKVV